jgi:hypothetical protein
MNVKRELSREVPSGIGREKGKDTETLRGLKCDMYACIYEDSIKTEPLRSCED